MLFENPRSHSMIFQLVIPEWASPSILADRSLALLHILAHLPTSLPCYPLRALSFPILRIQFGTCRALHALKVSIDFGIERRTEARRVLEE